VRAVSTFPRDETVAWWVHRNQQAVVIRGRDGETRFPRLVEWLAKIGLRSLCALPLTTAHRQLGSLVFVGHLDDAYSTEDQRFLSLVADEIALAMDDARAHQRLRLLLDLTNRVVTKLNWRDLLEEISVNIRQVMQCEAVAVVLPDPEGGELRLYFVDSPGQEEMHAGPISERIRTVFRTGQAANFTEKEIAADPNAALKQNSMCLYPLLSRAPCWVSGP
jgi:formate hydrogenlyase transcriptional activator